MDLNGWIDTHQEDIIKAARELISIPSVEGQAQPGMPFGPGVDKALKYILSLSKSLGFHTRDVDGYAGIAEFGEGEETLGILVHLDVVPEGSGWTYPPFGGEIHEGRLYGRGAMDDKGPAAAALYAMKAVMESGRPIGKKVRIFFGTDEESGGKDFEFLFQQEPMPDLGITPDADYPVIFAEKGILVVALKKAFAQGDCMATTLKSLAGGHRPNMVPDECECVFECCDENEKVLTHLTSFGGYSEYELKADFNEEGDVIIRSLGRSAHGSTPEKGKNAIGQMLAFLATLGLGDSELEKFILTLNHRLGVDTTGEQLGLKMEDSVSGPLTMNLGIIELNRNWGKAVLDIRYPVKYSQEEVLSRIKESLEGTGIEVQIEEHLPPLYVPQDHFLIKTLQRVYTEQTGQPAELLAIGGGTYARSIPNGVAFGALFPGRPETAHQKDEYIEIGDLIMNAKIYAHAIYELTR